MITKCIKIALEYNKNNTINQKELFNELKDIQYKTYLACNRAITYLYTNDIQNFIQKDIGIPKEDDKQLYGKSFNAWIENRMNEIMEGCLSTNVAQTRQFVCNRYKNDKSAGLLKGNVSISQFKRDIPIIIHNKAYSINTNDKGYCVEIGLFNLPKQKELGIKRILFNIPKLNGNEKATLQNIMLKTYKQGSAQIEYNSRKKKWMLTVSFSFDSKPVVVNKDLIMGIDLGITKVATISIFDSVKNQYLKMNWKDTCIDGAELIHYRQKIEARRKSLSIATKWASDNKIGHGRKTRMKSANQIGDKYNRFKDTFNHKISRYIIDLAVKYGVGTIQMEDLSGFSEQQSESLLKNWSYYDLQNKIKYKAEEKGIDVIFINPKYTSKRCSVCGNIDNANRDCKKDQANFTCTCCGHHENADINASKNIAIPYIDKIINEYISNNKED